MKHFIITRFNDYFPAFDEISTDDPDPRFSNREVLNPLIGIDDRWLEIRMRLFFEITVPSVSSQTDTDFTWLLKCHHLTPGWAKRILVGNFVPNYDPHYSSPAEVFSGIIRRMCRDKEVITTRLDSDDGISREYVQIVKDQCRPGMFFDFERGVVVTPQGVHLHRKTGYTSQFCSYFDTYALLTVYHKPHCKISPDERIRDHAHLGWIQTNHEHNITRDIKRCGRYADRVGKDHRLEVLRSFPSLPRSWMLSTDEVPLL